MNFFIQVLLGAAHLFTGVFNTGTLKDAASSEMANVEQATVAFVKTDLGKLALDAIDVAEGKLAGSKGTDKFAAAKVQFIADAKAAGHDLETLGLGVVDWMVQTAYTYTANVVAKIPTVQAS